MAAASGCTAQGVFIRVLELKAGGECVSIRLWKAKTQNPKP